MFDRQLRLLGLLAVSGALACACASAPPVRSQPGAAPIGASAAPPPEGIAAPAESGGLAFAVEPPEAEVLIDGRSYGAVGALARSGTLQLPPGLYQVSLRCAGYATWRAEVAIRAAVEPIRVTLARRSPSP